MNGAVQWLIVAAVVGGCAAYAAWQLAPKVVQRRAAQLLVRAVPRLAAWSPVRAALRTAATGGCGCDGCDQGPAPPGAAAADERKVIRIVPR